MNIDIQGHRGCRGLYPENSIPAFVHALELGVNTLEFDAVISKDKKVIVSHEPFMSHSICTDSLGDTISIDGELNFNIYTLTYDEIKAFDCGSHFIDKFPEQKKLNTHKPSLQDVVNTVEKINNKILYNIEIKRKPEWDNIYHPAYKEFADLVIQEIKTLGIFERTTVQCFDVETLQYIHEKYQDVRLVYLIANEDNYSLNIEKLGFNPFVYSPFYKLVNQELVIQCKLNNVQLIPWTVNELLDMEMMLSLGVDGIITDYPDRLIQLVKKY